MSEEKLNGSVSAAKAARRAAIAVAPLPEQPVTGIAEPAAEIAEAAELVAEAVEAAPETVEAVAEPVTAEVVSAETAIDDAVETVAAAVETAVTEPLEAAPSAPEAVAAGSAFAEKAALRIKALSDASTALTLGMQEASRTWLAATQGGMKLQREGLSKLAACRTPLDLMTAQGELALRGLESAAETGESIVRTSTRAIEAAGRALQA